MNQLKKIGCHCAVRLLAVCAVAVSPVILIYGVPFGIGIVSDLVRIADGQALLCVVSAPPGGVFARSCRPRGLDS